MLTDRKCLNCQYLKEDLLETSKDEDLKECPLCKEKKFIRVLSPASFKINGYSESNGYGN